MYSLGLAAAQENGSAASLPYFKKAIELDPNFAEAYALTATMYGNLGESSLATEYAEKGYALRERVTEREKLQLDTLETSYVTGDLVKDEEAMELFKRTYPREAQAFGDLAVDEMSHGDYQGALGDALKALELEPRAGIIIGNTAWAYIGLERFDDAKAVLDRGVANGVDPAALAFGYYILAFLRNDTAEMQKQVELVAGKPYLEGSMLGSQSATEAYHGRLNKAREYIARAIDSAKREGTLETAGQYAVQGALQEMEFGNFLETRRAATAAMTLAPQGRYVLAVAALALAQAGDDAQARKLSDDLARKFPQDTYLNFYWLPMARATIELHRHNPDAALAQLRTAQTYELGGSYPQLDPLLVVYLRGQSYLAAKQNKEAQAEFQKILDHPGIVLNFQVGALAHIGLGRALAAAGDSAKARTAYQDFFALWKDADPDIPILKQAKAEYAKLQ
jgi:tetratricopeptide (TPR) repeat protein